MHLETEKSYEVAMFDMKTQNKRMVDELNRQKAMCMELQAQVDNLLLKNKEIENDYNCIVNSTSWKISKPIRGFLDMIKRKPK